MSAPTLSRVGGVVSADIAVPQHEQEVRFYASVLTTGATPLWREDLMNNRGVPIIGLGEHKEEYGELPLQWMPHIQVADVGASAAAALERGAQEVMHGKDENGVSQWAVLLDPDGAAFGLIPVVSEEQLPPSDGTGPEGCIGWLDLTVADASKARDFYCAVVGWTAQDAARADASGDYADFTLLGSDGKPAAGVCHARGDCQGRPAVWLITLPVGDLEESLRRVRAEGGQVLHERRDESGACTHAVIQDPVGVHLALIPG